MRFVGWFILFFYLGTFRSLAQSFTVVPLGVKGGSDESNLSAYALAVHDTDQYVCLDAGTIHYGIQKSIVSGVFKGEPGEFIRNNIKGYLISHAHLDHVEGLVINSPDDSPKPIYGLPDCLDILKDKYFNWKNWANFANEGEKPTLNKYHYTVLYSDHETLLENTTLYAQAFPLSHGNPYQSTAFLIRHDENYLVYLGDTGADLIERSDKLHRLWEVVSPLIKSKKLKAIFIEVSFSNDQPEDKLFGHLTPKLLMGEMKVLNDLSGGLADFPVVITHRKPSGDREENIRQQLIQGNIMKVKLIFPEQAKALEF